MTIVSLIISLALVLILVNKKINMGYSMIIGAITLALLNGKGISYILIVFFKTVSNKTTITLALTIAFITILAYLMDRYMILDRMVFSLETVLRSAKLTILLAPSIMGTLLVYGGALMSCPVVGRLGDRLSIPNEKKATINLIFRHALYLIFPLSPSMLLAAELGSINIWDLIKLQFPISIIMYAIGYFLFVRSNTEPILKKVSKKEYFRAILGFLLYGSPILVSILGVLLFSLPFYISLIIGISICVLINTHDKTIDSKYNTGESLVKTIYKGVKIPLVLAIIGILFYRNIVTDMNEIYVFFESLLDKGLPIELLILVACGVICVSLASPQPGIAILFPIVLPLAPNYDIRLLYAMFIFTTSFMFYYISPLHLCQVLTLEYFGVNLKKLYRNYVYLLPITFLSMVVIYFANML